jgi:DNA-directed RNA polymerase specialized sigma24 family protein
VATKQFHDHATELWIRTTSDATRVAFLMGAELDDSHRIAVRAFRHASALWMERRDPMAFERWSLAYSIRAATRAIRIRRLQTTIERFFHRDKGDPKPADAGDLLGRLRPLGPRHKAVIVLAFFKELDMNSVADVLQTSPSGAGSLRTRALTELGVGSEGEAELSNVLAAAAVAVPLPELRREVVERTYLTSRLTGVFLWVATSVGLVAALIFGGMAVRSGAEGAGPEPTPTVAPDRVLAPEIPPSELLGAPSWCPRSKRMLPLSANDGVEAVGVASRVNLGLINNYQSSVDRLVERPPGAPLPAQWPATTDDAGQRVVASVPAEANSLLASRCGHLVARRTWEVILEAPGAPQHDGVAFYLVKRAAGMRVWGTYAGSGSD